MRTAFRRKPVASGNKHTMRAKQFPAPMRGWVLNENPANSDAGGARQLDNWFPTTTGIRLRGGSLKRATISTGAVLSLFSYNSGANDKFFAADAENVFDITTVADASTIPSPAIMGQSGGEYAATQFTTAGGDYLIIVNGFDVMWRFDGTNWYPCTDVAIRVLNYDGGTTAFERGETVTGGTSGASAEIIAINGNATSGVLYIGTVSGGAFQNNETITSLSGAAVANGADAAGSSVAITGKDTATLSHVWPYASRLFFVEKNTMTAWFLPVDSIGGALSSFSLAGIFKDGGSLLFGATWSLDAGDGLDDKAVFISDQGEVAIYEGTDPSSSANWRKVGVYRIGVPLGINATLQAGGDLLVATVAGIVPLSEAIKKDVAALSLAAVSRNIEPAWKAEATARADYPWHVLKWSEASMMVIATPVVSEGQTEQCFVANLETGAWARYTGWNTRCLGLFRKKGYFGSNDGTVNEMEITGLDNATPYTAVYVSHFDNLNAPGSTKTAHQARAIFTAQDPFIAQVSCSTNYEITLPAAPNSIANYSNGEWDSAIWDTALWGASGTTTNAVTTATQWVSIGETGFSHAPQVQITCGVTPTPDVELVSFDLTYTVGGVVV